MQSRGACLQFEIDEFVKHLLPPFQPVFVRECYGFFHLAPSCTSYMWCRGAGPYSHSIPAYCMWSQPISTKEFLISDGHILRPFNNTALFSVAYDTYWCNPILHQGRYILLPGHHQNVPRLFCFLYSHNSRLSWLGQSRSDREKGSTSFWRKRKIVPDTFLIHTYRLPP